MKEKITFWKLLNRWLIVAVIADLINLFIIKVPVLHNIILASLGIILLIFPVYPLNMENKYTAKQCRLFVRLGGVIVILLALSLGVLAY